MTSNTIDYNGGDKLPNIILFNNNKYSGNATFIKGYNGYTSTEDDGYMCALINNSCWDSNGKPNLLTDEKGMYIRAIHNHYLEMKIINGIILKHNLN